MLFYDLTNMEDRKFLPGLVDQGYLTGNQLNSLPDEIEHLIDSGVIMDFPWDCSSALLLPYDLGIMFYYGENLTFSSLCVSLCLCVFIFLKHRSTESTEKRKRTVTFDED